MSIGEQLELPNSDITYEDTDKAASGSVFKKNPHSSDPYYSLGRATSCEERDYFILHDLTWHALAVMSEGVSGEKAGLRAAPT